MLLQKIIEFVSSPIGAAIVTALVPLIAAKLSPTAANILYAILGGIFKIPIPPQISDKTWDGLALDGQQYGIDDYSVVSAQQLITAASNELSAGHLNNARDILKVIIERADKMEIANAKAAPVTK